MRVKFHPEARAELREAKRWYRDRSPLAALAFGQMMEEAVGSITATPLRYAVGEFDTREYIFPRRFPYTIVYRIRMNDIVVVAIAHQSREPGYWHNR